MSALNREKFNTPKNNPRAGRINSGSIRRSRQKTESDLGTPGLSRSTTIVSILPRSQQVIEIDRETEEELRFLSDLSRQATQIDPEAEDLEHTALEKTPSKEPEAHEIRCQMYKKECKKLNVIPISCYLREPIRNVLLIPYWQLGPRGAMALAAPLMLDTNITNLDLAGNYIGQTGLEHLMEAFNETQVISHLNLSKNKLGSGSAKVLCNSIKKFSMFEVLNLSDNGFKDDVSKLFANAVEKSKSLREINLSHNELSEKAGFEFAKTIENNDRLEALDLSWNHINGKAAEALARSVKKNVGLRRLNVSFNGFGQLGAKGFSVSLKKNRSLQELDISNNRMVDGDMEVLAAGLKENDTLQTLIVGDNLLTHEAAMHLLNSIEDPKSNTVLQKLDLKNTSVDQEFIHLLAEVQQNKKIDIRYGKVMNVGVPRKPRRKKRRRKTLGSTPQTQTTPSSTQTQTPTEHVSMVKFADTHYVKILDEYDSPIRNTPLPKIILEHENRSGKDSVESNWSHPSSVVVIPELSREFSSPMLLPPPTGIVKESTILEYKMKLASAPVLPAME